MHSAIINRPVGKIVRLLDMQRIHIGPQGNCPTAATFFQGSDNPGSAKAPVDLETELG